MPSLDGRQVFLHGLCHVHGRSFCGDRSPLRPQVEAVVLHLEEGDAVGPFRQGLVEDEDGGLDAGVGVEDASGQGDDGH